MPADVTVFLPSNAAVAALLKSVPLPGLSVDTITSGALPSAITNRLISALLFHIAPGTYTPEELTGERASCLL